MRYSKVLELSFNENTKQDHDQQKYPGTLVYPSYQKAFYMLPHLKMQNNNEEMSIKKRHHFLCGGVGILNFIKTEISEPPMIILFHR